MSITAKYAATCCSCGKPITPGQKIEWTKGQPVRHASCGATATAPAAAKASTPGVCHCGRACPGYTTCYRHSAAATTARAAGVCANCSDPLSTWERNHGVLRCADCRDGGGNAHGGQSYHDRHGNFVLGDDD